MYILNNGVYYIQFDCTGVVDASIEIESKLSSDDIIIDLIFITRCVKLKRSAGNIKKENNITPVLYSLMIL